MKRQNEETESKIWTYLGFSGEIDSAEFPFAQWFSDLEVLQGPPSLWIFFNLLRLSFWFHFLGFGIGICLWIFREMGFWKCRDREEGGVTFQYVLKKPFNPPMLERCVLWTCCKTKILVPFWCSLVFFIQLSAVAMLVIWASISISEFCNFFLSFFPSQILYKILRCRRYLAHMIHITMSFYLYLHILKLLNLILPQTIEVASTNHHAWTASNIDKYNKSLSLLSFFFFF